MVLVSDIQSFLTIKGHRHGPGELPVTGAKALAELSQVLLIQRADAHTDGGGTRWVTPIQHKNAPISAHGDVVRIGKATPVVAIVHNTDGLDVFERYTWRSGLSAHFSPPLGQLEFPGRGDQAQHIADPLFGCIAWLMFLEMQ